MHTHSKRHHSFCRLCTVCKCVYGGVISQNSTIRIELTHDQPMVDMNNELKSNPFSFSPSLKGKAYWVSNNTIEFVPEEGALKPGTLYEGTFRLGDFIEVDKKLKSSTSHSVYRNVTSPCNWNHCRLQLPNRMK